eukprot:10121159-Alexandrium_andersonii.AAC.1
MRAWARLAPVAGSGLGRAVFKFASLHAQISELEAVASKLALELTGYSSGPKRSGSPAAPCTPPAG